MQMLFEAHTFIYFFVLTLHYTSHITVTTAIIHLDIIYKIITTKLLFLSNSF